VPSAFRSRPQTGRRERASNAASPTLALADAAHSLARRRRPARGGDRPAITASLADTAGLGARPAAERAAWAEALAYYSADVARRDILFDAALVAAKAALAERGSVGRYWAAVERHWRPHLDGQTSLREAVRAIVAELP
jgi:hypothetical protein